jgi:hypothetical protein
VSYLKKRVLGWKTTVKIGNEVFVPKAEADAVVNHLILLGDKMSLEMMKQMLHGISDQDFISAHYQYQVFVYEKGWQEPKKPDTLPPPSKRKK